MKKTKTKTKTKDGRNVFLPRKFSQKYIRGYPFRSSETTLSVVYWFAMTSNSLISDLNEDVVLR